MDRQEYLVKLENESGYCKCPELNGLFEKRRGVEKLEAKCRFYHDNVDLENPRGGDGRFLREYRGGVEELRDAVKNYRNAIRDEAQIGHIELKFHGSWELNVPRKVSFGEACEIQKINDFTILTAHCKRCEQQIDVVSA